MTPTLTPPKAPTPTKATAAASWTITLAAEGDGPPAVVRVRRLLKAARRAYGLRALEVRELTP